MEKIDSVLVRYNEIGIKGNNRGYFEKKLITNIKDCLKKNKIDFSITKYFGRIIINTQNKCFCLKTVFGISSISPAFKVELNFDKIKEQSLKLYSKGSFRISSKRLNKKFNIGSEELNKSLGEFIIEKTKAKVNLIKPDCNVGVEIMDRAYLFNERYECLGGLPVGVEGLVTLIIEDEKDLLAGILMMKRGCNLEVINKKNIDFSILEKYSYGNDIRVVNFPSKESLAVVKMDKLENLKNTFEGKIVLNPLIGNEKDLLKEF